MPITIEIPTAFRRFTEGAPKVDCSATTIAEALNELTSRFPALSRHVRDDEGQIRQFLNVYLNEEDIRFLGGIRTPRRRPHPALMKIVSSISSGSSQLSALDRVLGSMRPRIVMYALASLLLLAFHAPFRALAFLISDIRDPRPLQRTAR